MDQYSEHRPLKRIVWGAFLILLGTAFLLQRTFGIDMPSFGQLWPLVLYVIAVGAVIEGKFGSAVTFVTLGTWFFACELGWYGLTYHNSWPLVLIGSGVGMVIAAITRENTRHGRRRRDPEVPHV